LKEDDRSPLPIRATAIVLAIWITTLVVLALVVVPSLFAQCTPASAP
jgi:hypothetical protein